MFYLILFGLLLVNSGSENNSYPEDDAILFPPVNVQDQCDKCHNANVVEAKVAQYSKSRHFRGRTFRRARTNECAPCHTHEGFLDVVKNNTPAEFITDPSNPSRFRSTYIASDSSLVYPGPISCFTCHSSIHTKYTPDEFYPLTSIKPVPMKMWGGSKTLSFSRESSNLCAKCHQPQPILNASGKNIDYTKLSVKKDEVFNDAPLLYGTGIHNSTQSAIFSGTGAVEFGSGYKNSAHTSKASCTNCHMGEVSGSAGGHTFSAQGNFKGCNKPGCHSSRNGSDPELIKAVNDVKSRLKILGEKLDRIAETGILKKDTATGAFTGYLDIYDPQSNPSGKYRSPVTSGWSEDNLKHNSSLPPFPQLSNAQFGAFLNFQMVLGDRSLGIHNFNYTRKLLKRSATAF